MSNRSGIYINPHCADVQRRVSFPAGTAGYLTFHAQIADVVQLLVQFLVYFVRIRVECVVQARRIEMIVGIFIAEEPVFCKQTPNELR